MAYDDDGYCFLLKTHNGAEKFLTFFYFCGQNTK